MKALQTLVDVFEQTTSKEELKNLLEGLLTPSEIEEVAQRIDIVRLLKKGMGQHAVAKKLHIGVATVTRGAKKIKEGNFKYVE